MALNDVEITRQRRIAGQFFDLSFHDPQVSLDNGERRLQFVGQMIEGLAFCAI